MICVAYKGNKPGEGEVKFMKYEDLPTLPGRWNIRGPFADKDTAEWSLTLKNQFSIINMTDAQIKMEVTDWASRGRPNSIIK